MREIWETPFGNAILKIERANKHISDFKERLCTSSDRHGPTLHMDGKTGEQFLSYGLHDRELRSDLALITGDAVHNLRSALDIAWVEIFRQIAASRSNHTKFPIDRNKPRQWIVGVLKSAGVDETSRVFDFVVNHVKGYEGGDPDILALHDLDIDDKHRVLIPTVTATGVKGVELECEDGTDARNMAHPTELLSQCCSLWVQVQEPRRGHFQRDIRHGNTNRASTDSPDAGTVLRKNLGVNYVAPENEEARSPRDLSYQGQATGVFESSSATYVGCPMSPSFGDMGDHYTPPTLVR